MIALMQHYDIKLPAPLGSDSNPIWIKDEEMDNQGGSVFFLG